MIDPFLIASPEDLPKLDKLLHDRPVEDDAAFKPGFPAHITARDPDLPSVYDDEFGMHNTERADEDTLNPHLKARKLHSRR